MQVHDTISWRRHAVLAALVSGITYAAPLLGAHGVAAAASAPPPPTPASISLTALVSRTIHPPTHAPHVIQFGFNTGSSTMHTPAAGIPEGGTTGNGCAITPVQAAAERYILGMLNAHRAAAGVRPLRLNTMLARASRDHSCDMAVHSRLQHAGTDGSAPDGRIDATGIPYGTWAENIGECGGAIDAGLASIDAQFMAEPLVPSDHHWNILNPEMTDVGIGVILHGGNVWFTQDFIN